MDLSEKYLIWMVAEVPREYVVDDIKWPKNVESYELNQGESVIKKWSDDAVCLLTYGDPKKPVIPDNLSNTHSLLIVSERLKKALEELQPAQPCRKKDIVHL